MSDSEENNFAEIQAQWAAVRGRIRQKIGDAQFKSWIKLLTLEDYVDQKVILSVPSNFIRTRILEQYLEIIKSYWLVQNLKINDIEILVSNTKKNASRPIDSTKVLTLLCNDSGILLIQEESPCTNVEIANPSNAIVAPSNIAATAETKISRPTL